MRKENFLFPKGVSGSISKSENDHFGKSAGFFFCVKKSWSYCSLGWNLLEITVMLQSFHHYFGITVKIRKNRIFHCFFYFWPWSRNNYVMNSMPWYFPVNFTPKNYMSKFNLRKKNFRFPKGVSGSISKLINDHFVMSAGIFFFGRKKVDHSVFWREIHRRLP